jgi:acetoin utilization deacetylase AcuC-like enzyme
MDLAIFVNAESSRIVQDLPMRSIPVFFTPKMAAPSESYSPSSEKPLAVVERWKRLPIPLRIVEPKPVTERELALAHDPAYVDGVLRGRIANGFGNRSPKVAASLPYTSGAMLEAAIDALSTKTAAVAPCSGFHHAGYAQGGGFCTFNGLMVSACALRERRLATRVGILDCDMHYGDGTDDIIEAIGAKDWLMQDTIGAQFRSPNHAGMFLETLARRMHAFFEGCDVLLYQAGADPHLADPLGGWLTDEELRKRDRIVFTEARRLGIPIAWNLAGGYQRDRSGAIDPVLRIHVATLEEHARAWDLY